VARTASLCWWNIFCLLPQQNNGKTMALHAVATHFKYGIQRPPWQRHELSSVISLSFLDVYDSSPISMNRPDKNKQRKTQCLENRVYLYLKYIWNLQIFSNVYKLKDSGLTEILKRVIHSRCRVFISFHFSFPFIAEQLSIFKTHPLVSHFERSQLLISFLPKLFKSNTRLSIVLYLQFSFKLVQDKSLTESINAGETKISRFSAV
jgi:hypothetical protein